MQLHRPINLLLHLCITKIVPEAQIKLTANSKMLTDNSKNAKNTQNMKAKSKNTNKK